jgi:hypothetical protein
MIEDALRLLALRWAVSRARRQRAGLEGAVLSTLPAIVLAAGALALAALGAALLGGQQPDAAAIAAGRLADLGLLLGLLAVALAGARPAAADEDALVLVPAGRSARALASLLEALVSPPVLLFGGGVVIGLLAGAARHDPVVALRIAPTAAGWMLVLAGAAATMQRITARLRRPGPLARSAGAGTLVLLLGAGIVAVASAGPHAAAALPTPGRFAGRALALALEADPRTLVAALALHLVAAGFGITLAAMPLTPPPARYGRRRPRRGWPREATRLAGAPGGAAALVQAAAGAVVLLALTGRLAAVAGPDVPVASIGALTASFLLAAAPAAIAGNLLGCAGPAGALELAAARTPSALLARPLLLLAGIGTAGVAAASTWTMLVAGEPSGGLLAFGAGTAVVVAGCGTGALVSVRAPHAVRAGPASDSAWPPGQAAWIVPAVQLAAVAPAALHLLVPALPIGPTAALVLCWIVAALAAGAGAVALARLRNRRPAIVEALLP